MITRAFVTVGDWHVDVAEIVAWKVVRSSDVRARHGVPGQPGATLTVVTKNDITFTFTTTGDGAELVELMHSAISPADPLTVRGARA